jgi:HK97 family phage major capsid protein
MTDNILEVKGLFEETKKTLVELQNEAMTKKEFDALDKEKQEKMNKHLDNLEMKLEKATKEIEMVKAVANRPELNQKENDDANDLEYKSAYFKQYIARGNEMTIKSLSAGIMEDGGYTVPKSTLQLIEGRIFETSDVERYAKVVNTANGYYEFVIDNDEAGVNLVSEYTASSNTATPKLQKGIIQTHIYDAFPFATQTLLEDAAINMESWLGGKVADKIARKSSRDFVLGDGIDKASGFLHASNLAAASKALTADDVYSATKIETFKSGSATAFTIDNLLAFIGKLKFAYRKNIYSNRKTRTYIRTLKDGDNRFIYDVQKDGAITVDGLTHVVFEDIPSIGDGNACLVAGDLSRAYTVVKRRGITIKRDDLTNKPFVGFYTTARVGGGIEVPEAIKVLITQV